MAGERTVKIKFIGESKSVAKAAAAAERSVKKLNDNVGKAVGGLGEKIGGAISGAVEALPPMGKLVAGALGAGLAVGLAPVIAAAISSAVLLALGGGVLALGIKSAIDSPKVAKAFEPLKKKASKIFEDFGKPFEKPLIRAAKTFEKTLDRLRPHIERLGELIAPVIDRLAPALGKFFENAMPGITKAVEAAVPLFNTLAEKLPGIGEAIGRFFGSVSENGEDTNQFFSDMLTLIAGTIIVFGQLISKLASWYSNVRDFLGKAKLRFLEFKVFALNQIGGLLDGATSALGWIPGIGPKLKSAQKAFASFRAAANAELQAIRDRTVQVTIKARRDAKLDNQLGRNPAFDGLRASGGPVSAGRSYLVGERGPEVITMQGNGYVTPNRDLGGGFTGDLYVEVDLGNAVRQTIKVANRDLKRRAGARGAYA